MKNILVPTDFSTEANHALKIAADIVRKTNGSIYLLHVIDSPNGGTFSSNAQSTGTTPMDDIFILKLVERVKSDLADLEEQYSDIELITEFTIGEIYSKINEVVKKQDIEVIIMGSKGVSGINEVMIGSNTEKVVRLAPCPVLTVKPDTESLDTSDIVFASDFREDYSKVIPYLTRFQKNFDAKLHLLYVNVPNKFETSATIHARIKDFAHQHQLSNYDVNVYCDVHEEDGIINFCEDQGYNLIAVSTHSRRGLAHLIAGSIAEDIVNHSKQAVLTFSLKNL